MDIGETFAQSAIREVKEEARFDIRIDRIIGNYADPGHVFATMTAKCGGNPAFARCLSHPRSRSVLRLPSWVRSESVRPISVGNSVQWVIRHLGRARPETVAEVRNRVISFLRGGWCGR
jgi:8-oxo-dGTP pyrophosphatase MutT (NUDIX family)